ncbi:DNA-binding transcriptional MerR regulator [Nesterenkonia xinjiangensis]|uniref:DNA-binding transcriptional MerR regulator n=1 Tax=Nesterenkonia xinjiangensis TaxID=225327 RepID=A0A7Z0GII5_9MICC|nr:DNA-binding transcriptional MerR regulator [Nesterenkonia xinjiangensis]
MSLDSRADEQRAQSRTPEGAHRASSRPALQQRLFDDGLPDLDEEMGYRGPIACAAAGITYRQLDYWARTQLVQPSLRNASGSGSARLYSFRDILVLKVVKRLLDTGVSLQQIRSAIEHLRERGVEDLAQITLMSDGASVYECTSADEVIDLVQGGQGVFGIAVGRVWREVEGSLAELPRERSDVEDQTPAPVSAEQAAGSELSAFSQQDEIAKMRARRRSQAS